jgi:hypothetical protein
MGHGSAVHPKYFVFKTAAYALFTTQISAIKGLLKIKSVIGVLHLKSTFNYFLLKTTKKFN